MKTINSRSPFTNVCRKIIFVLSIICLGSYSFLANAGNFDPITNDTVQTITSSEMILILTPHVYPNGFNESCFGKADGSIDLTIVGGIPPYTCTWSNDESTEDIYNLAAGYYHLLVKDKNGQRTEAEITLRQPDPKMKPIINGVVLELINGYNVSCYDCYNGEIELTVTGGSGVYTYKWSDGPTTEDRYGLGAGSYSVVITDASACGNNDNYERSFTLKGPERSDWSMGGNGGTNPPTQYLGTTDDKDIVFKTNNAENLRIKSNGNVGIGTAYPTENLTVVGNSSISNNFNVGGNVGIGVANPSEKLEISGNGKVSGNFNIDGNIGIGTTNPSTKFEVVGNGKITANLNIGGKVGIGTDSIPANYLIAVGGKMLCTEINVQLVNDWVWPDFVFAPNYSRMTLPELEQYINTYKHLPDLPSAEEVKSKGVNVGETNSMLLQKIEELTLYMIELNKKYEELQMKVEQLEKTSN